MHLINAELIVILSSNINLHIYFLVNFLAYNIIIKICNFAWWWKKYLNNKKKRELNGIFMPDYNDNYVWLCIYEQKYWIEILPKKIVAFYF